MLLGRAASPGSGVRVGPLGIGLCTALLKVGGQLVKDSGTFVRCLCAVIRLRRPLPRLSRALFERLRRLSSYRRMAVFR